ncbi:MAG TPA: GNAT family protein [Puia sp.]|jgi:RimJ/RimL family protein N-acetyltransferase
MTQPIIDAGSLPLLKGNHVFLTFLTEEDREPLRQLARDPRLWEFTKTLLINDQYDLQFDVYFNDALALTCIGEQAFVIRDTKDDHILGMTRLFSIERKNKKLEIGHTWYIPAVWGKAHNKECKLLLLQYVLETLQFNRVQFRVAHQNLRSQKAVTKIGGVKEGVLRRDGIRNDGSRRDTVIFSIITDEWPEKKAGLLRLLS